MHKKILKMPVAITSYKDTVSWITKSTEESTGKYVCVANVHMCMETFDSDVFCKVVNSADLVVPDGRPLVWSLKFLGITEAEQVRGSDLLLHLCRNAEKNNIPIGLYGGTPDSLSDFKDFLRKTFPSLNIACTISPPFRPLTQEEDALYVQKINDAGVRILFVGIGCPKQENWMRPRPPKL